MDESVNATARATSAPCAVVVSRLLAVLFAGVWLGGCCELPNTRHPETKAPDPKTTVILYGDSNVDRLGDLQGYGTELAARLAARGEVVVNSGNAGREAGVAAITDPVRDRCPALVCHLFYDCLAKGNTPLVTVLNENPNARTLVMTLGGVEAGEALSLGSIGHDLLDVSKPTPKVVEDIAAQLLRNMAKAIEIARADRDWKWIGITSYPYMPTDSRDPVVPCSLATPVDAAAQKHVNDILRTLDRMLGAVAEHEGVHFVSLLDVHGGGEPVPGGENGPPGRWFDNCAHLTPEGYSAVVDRILAAMDAPPSG